MFVTFENTMSFVNLTNRSTILMFKQTKINNASYFIRPFTDRVHLKFDSVSHDSRFTHVHCNKTNSSQPDRRCI